MHVYSSSFRKWTTGLIFITLNKHLNKCFGPLNTFVLDLDAHEHKM